MILIVCKSKVSSTCQLHMHTHTHTCLTALFPGLPGWAGTRKVKPIWILLKQETVSGSGISWAICKSAPCSRQTTTPAPHTLFFTGRMPFLPPNQQCQSTEGTCLPVTSLLFIEVWHAYNKDAETFAGAVTLGHTVMTSLSAGRGNDDDVSVPAMMHCAATLLITFRSVASTKMD